MLLLLEGLLLCEFHLSGFSHCFLLLARYFQIVLCLWISHCGYIWWWRRSDSGYQDKESLAVKHSQQSMCIKFLGLDQWIQGNAENMKLFLFRRDENQIFDILLIVQICQRSQLKMRNILWKKLKGKGNLKERKPLKLKSK